MNTIYIMNNLIPNIFQNSKIKSIAQFRLFNITNQLRTNPRIIYACIEVGKSINY